MGSKMGAADPNYPKIQGLSRLSRLSYGIAAHLYLNSLRHFHHWISFQLQRYKSTRRRTSITVCPAENASVRSQ